MRLCDKNNSDMRLDTTTTTTTTTTFGIVGLGAGGLTAAERISDTTSSSLVCATSGNNSHVPCQPQELFWKESATSTCRFYSDYDKVAKEGESCSSSDDEDEDRTLRSSGQTWNESRQRESTAPMYYQQRRCCQHHRQFFSHLLPATTTTTATPTDSYRGIPSNPPAITLQGVARGNVAQIHAKAWLEVSDENKHRYGKNLRLYYRHWESLGYPHSHNFFDWLDSKGTAAGQPLPSLDECPRSVLDSDTVLYITNPKVTRQYALVLEPCEGGRCRVLHSNNNNNNDDQQPVVATGPKGWIFVLRDNVFYGAEKVAAGQEQQQQRFHHSSFFGGKAVAAAGIFITDNEGRLELLYPHSGHYRPGEADMQRILFFLHRLDIDLSTFQVDTQQLIRVNRHPQQHQEGTIKKSSSSKPQSSNSELHCAKNKRKKTESLRLKPAIDVAHYLSHKAHFIGGGILSEIEGTSAFHSYIPCHQQRTE